MLPGPVNVAFLATFIACFWPIFRFRCLFGNIFRRPNLMKNQMLPKGNIFEQTYHILVIVCKISALEQIRTTRFVRIQFFFIHTQFFFHFFSNSLFSNSFPLSSVKILYTIQFLIKYIFTQQKIYQKLQNSKNVTTPWSMERAVGPIYPVLSRIN